MTGTARKETREPLLEPGFLSRLEALRLLARRLRRGETTGERRSKRKGHSPEFSDYRPYSIGDDPRFIDWNVYARTDRLHIKVSVAEEDLHVYALLDTSLSMDFGTPTKLLLGKRLAAAVSYIALANLERAGVALLEGRSARLVGPMRGRRSARVIFDALLDADAGGETNLFEASRAFSAAAPKPGIVVIISDLLDPGGYGRAVDYLGYMGHEVVLVHILADEEVSPEIKGDLRLLDSETRRVIEVTAGGRLERRYRSAVAAFGEGVESFARLRGISCVRTTSSVPVEDLAMGLLRRSGVLG